MLDNSFLFRKIVTLKEHFESHRTKVWVREEEKKETPTDFNLFILDIYVCGLWIVKKLKYNWKLLFSEHRKKNKYIKVHADQYLNWG